MTRSIPLNTVPAGALLADCECGGVYRATVDSFQAQRPGVIQVQCDRCHQLKVILQKDQGR